MINKILKNIHYLILIMVPFGWLLNYRYYWARFNSEGFDAWLCVMISIILVVFASIIFAAANHFKKSKNKIFILFIIVYAVLAFYSINCTTAGQYWDQQIKNEETKITESEKDNLSFIIVQYQDNIKNAQIEYNKLNEIKDKSIENLSDMYDYKHTSREVEKMKSDLKAEIKEYEKKIEIILNNNKISIKEIENRKKSQSLYVFYAGGVKNAEKVQFIFQVILSIIIELIAQLSIFIFMSIGIVKPEEEEKKKVVITQAELKHFAVFAWTKIENRNPPFLNQGIEFMKNMIVASPLFDEEKRKHILKVAMKNNLIKKYKKGYVPGSDWVNTDYFYKRICKLI